MTSTQRNDNIVDIKYDLLHNESTIDCNGKNCIRWSGSIELDKKQKEKFCGEKKDTFNYENKE